MSRISFLVALLVAFVAWCLPANAAIGVPSTLGTANINTPTATSLTITTTGAIVSGNLVVVGCFSYQSLVISSVSDGTNTYSPAAPTTSFANSAPALYYVMNASAVASSASLIITFSTAIGSGNYIICSAAQVSGAATNDTSAGVFAPQGTSGQPSLTSNALATSSEILFGFQVSAGDASQSSLSYTEDFFWTNLYNANSGLQLASNYFYSSFSYRIVASTSAQSWGPTYFPPANNGFAGILSAFEAGSAVATVHTLTLLGVGK